MATWRQQRGPRVAWILNLDADLELAAWPHRYQASGRVRGALRAFVPSLAASLLGPDDLLIDPFSDLEAREPAPAGEAAGLPGRAFCPTPNALAALARAGATPGPQPAVEVLRRVNSRAFSASLGMTMPHAAFVTDMEAARSWLDSDPVIGAAWRIKRQFGMAGRGQRVVMPTRVSAGDLALLRAGLLEGGVMIEPQVQLAAEYAVHGMLEEGGGFVLGELVRQQCDRRGQWVASQRESAASHGGRGRGGLARLLRDEAERVAGALSLAGYFGPFGIDAFVYRDRAGALRLQPRSEINARYTMGFACGFG
jgi:hypothetical protein